MILAQPTGRNAGLRIRSPRWFEAGLLAFTLPVFFIAAGCAHPRVAISEVAVPPATVQAAIRFRKEYLLAPGDQIEVIVRRVPEVSRVVTIRPDGKISLPLIQDVTASGLTVPEIGSRVAELLSARLANPEVNVIPTLVRQPMVYVAGDVTNVVPIPFREAPTAMQAVTLAGGLRRTAAARDISLIRLSEDGFIRVIPVVVVDKSQPAAYISLRATILQPDDILFVPENGRSQVNRFIDDFINKPLTTFNSIIGTYVNFKFIQILNR